MKKPPVKESASESVDTPRKSRTALVEASVVGRAAVPVSRSTSFPLKVGLDQTGGAFAAVKLKSNAVVGATVTLAAVRMPGVPRSPSGDTVPAPEIPPTTPDPATVPPFSETEARA